MGDKFRIWGLDMLSLRCFLKLSRWLDAGDWSQGKDPGWRRKIGSRPHVAGSQGRETEWAHQETADREDGQGLTSGGLPVLRWRRWN